MNKKIIIGIIAVILVAGGIYWFTQNQNGSGNSLPYGTTNTPSPTPATHNVTIQNFSFSPASLTVRKGDTVIWTNQDSVAHTITGNNGGPSSQSISTGGTYSYTFNSVGTFAYHCAIHPSMMGTVVVE